MLFWIQLTKLNFETVWSVEKERIPEIKPFIEQMIEKYKND